MRFFTGLIYQNECISFRYPWPTKPAYQANGIVIILTELNMSLSIKHVNT